MSVKLRMKLVDKIIDAIIKLFQLLGGNMRH